MLQNIHFHCIRIFIIPPHILTLLDVFLLSKILFMYGLSVILRASCPHSSLSLPREGKVRQWMCLINSRNCVCKKDCSFSPWSIDKKFYDPKSIDDLSNKIQYWTVPVTGHLTKVWCCVLQLESWPSVDGR